MDAEGAGVRAADGKFMSAKSDYVTRLSGTGNKMRIAGQKRRGLPPVTILLVAVAVSVVGLISWFPDVNTSTEAPKAYKTKTGKTIIISETHPVGRSLSTIEISTKGFEHNYADTFEDKDPISDVFVADLDGNGFDEIYIITTSAGSGSYGTVLGWGAGAKRHRIFSIGE
jgi:hypothetical protein